MENCLLMNCPKCRHRTVHHESKNTIGSYHGYATCRESYPKGKGGDTMCAKALAWQEKDYAKWREENTATEFMCTVCGRVWVKVEEYTIAGGMKISSKHSIKESISQYCNVLELK